MIIKKDDKAEWTSSFWNKSSKKALIKKIDLNCGTRLKTQEFSDIATLLQWMRSHLT